MSVDIPPAFTPATTEVREKWNGLIDRHLEEGLNLQGIVDEFGSRFDELLQLTAQLEFRLRIYSGEIEAYEDEAGGRGFREAGSPDGLVIKLD